MGSAGDQTCEPKVRLIKYIRAFLKDVLGTEGNVWSQPIRERQGSILISLIPGAEPLIERKPWSITRNPVGPRCALVDSYYRRDRIAHIAHRMAGGTTEHIVAVCRRENDSVAQLIRSFPRAELCGKSLPGHRRWSSHSVFRVNVTGLRLPGICYARSRGLSRVNLSTNRGGKQSRESNRNEKTTHVREL